MIVAGAIVVNATVYIVVSTNVVLSINLYIID